MFKQLCDDRKDASTMIPVVIGFAKSIDPFSELYIEENVFKYIINFVISALLICDNSEDMMLSALSACSVPLQSKDSYLVSSTQIVTKLKKTEFSDLVELLLCTIVNKSNPRHQVYNACFLYYVASKKLNKQKIPFIDDLFEPVSNEDVEKIRNESDNFINFIVNKTDNELIGTYDFFDPFLPELLLDEVVPGLILAKMFCHFNEENKQKIIQRVNEKKFICSLESLSKLFYEKKGEAVQNVQKCSPLSSYKVINKEDDDDDAKKLMSYYICSAHGELASEAAKRDAKKSTKNISNDIVPDNVVLIKLGRVGEQVLIDDINNTGDEAAKIQEIQYICSRNLNDLLLRGDTKNSACDVLAPGCALPSMTLRGDASFFSGIYDCTNYDTIEYYDDTQNYLFQDALTRVSEEAYETGHMALLVLIACQITADTGMIALGNIANRYYIRLGRKYTVVSMERNLNFEPESIIQEAYAIRHPPPRTPPVTTPPQQQSSPSSRGGSREISAVPYLIVAVLAAIVNSVT